MEWQEILDFWFKECSPEQRFKKDEARDVLIRERFSTVYKDIIDGKIKGWRKPQGILAQVIVLDQFARNMFRGKPEAFEHDSLALSLAQAAVEKKDDLKLPEEQRFFLYMPYMHSESREAHRQAILLFTKLADKEGLKYELMHKKIIDRFGRYPHRNAILGRTSTPEEEEYIKTHKGF